MTAEDPNVYSSDRLSINTEGYDIHSAYATRAEPRSPTRAEGGKEDARDSYGQLLRRELLGQSGGSELSGRVAVPRPSMLADARVLPLGIPSCAPLDTREAFPLYCGTQARSQKPLRKIAKAPFKVLDAPALQDDFYLNLVDWSSANTLAVGLGDAVYLWAACTSRVARLCELGGDDAVTSVGWSSRGSHLAVGTNRGLTLLWDVAAEKLVRTFEGHQSRVGALAWNSGDVLSTGSRDHSILSRDPRAPESFFARLSSHKQEVCGLEWSPDGSQLASGGNDNKLFVWDGGRASRADSAQQPILRFAGHQAAVKAIGWSPHQSGLLASGGGTADRTIRFWNTLTNTSLNCVDTGSQVCNLVWSKNASELVSTHGYSLNQIIVWRYPSMTKIATLTGHTYRVLYLALSPDGTTIVTGAGDETLRFWSVFQGARNDETGGTGAALNIANAVRIR